MKFKRIKEITYLNYFNLKNQKQPEKVTIKNALAIEIEGNYIVKEFDKSYLYIVKGTLITNRCGYSVELLNELIKSRCKPGDYGLQFKINKRLKKC
jgi:hypothetical protein